MRIFLGNSPWYKEGLYGVRAGSRWPHFEEEGCSYMPFPFYLAYAAAMLEDDGHSVKLIDAAAERMREDSFFRGMSEFDPELVLLEVSSVSLDQDMAIIEETRRRLPSAKIVLAGLHAPIYSGEFLDANSQVDVCLIGEYEAILVDLVRLLEDGGDLSECTGFVYRDGDGKGVSTGRRTQAYPVDQYPWPARHHLPMHRYDDRPGDIPGPSVQMWGSRGCPFHCNFCVWPQLMYGGDRYRPRDPVKMVDEMEYLVKEWGFKSVYFDDDTFNIGRPRLMKFAEELTRRRLGVPWAAMCRADLMDRELLVAFRQSGMLAVKYGVEAADQKVVNDCGKSLSIEKVKEVCRITNELGIRMHLTFMFGLPGETRQSAQATMDLGIELNPYSAQWSIATPFAGSRLETELLEKGHIGSTDYSKNDGYRTTQVRTDALTSEELEELAAEAQRRWLKHTVDRGPQGSLPVEQREGVSVVIPHLRGREILDQCLASLASQDKGPKEVLVVTAEDPGGLRQRYPEVQWIQPPEREGFAPAANAGIRVSRGKYVALVNDDAILAPDWLRNIEGALERSSAAGFAASRVLREDDREILDSAGDSLTLTGYAFSRGAGEVDSPRFNQKGYLFGASASAALYRRSMLEDIGLFDETFESYLEDVDLSLRANLWGYRCLYVPGAIAYHRGQTTSGGRTRPEVVRRLARNTIYLLLKNYPKQVLTRHWLRIGAYLAFMQLYHTVWTCRGLSYAMGLLEGVRRRQVPLASRKRVLGGMRVSQGEAYRILWDGKKDLREFKRTKLPRVLNALGLG